MNVVLVNPEIPWNTGNIGRSCIAAGATLHLVGKLGFRIDSKEIRRSGLDYWPRLKLELHKDFAAFEKSIPRDPSVFLFSTKASKIFWDAPFEKDSYLVFGSESAGLPEEVTAKYGDRIYKVPVSKDVRSLNLSSCAGIVLYEAVRQTTLRNMNV